MAILEKKLSIEDYLEFEKESDTRHEYIDGEMLAMAGEKRRHNNLVGRLYRLLIDKVTETSCEVVFETVKLRTRMTRYRYPDFVVSCNPGNDEYFIENPCFIAEILSGSTEGTDLTQKLDEYMRLPSVERYVMISQQGRFVTVCKRKGSEWVLETLDTNGEFDIPCLDTQVTLEQLYTGIL
ncbi:MAG: Uma2 family endonuclease [Trueperaceae bacterium]